MATSSAMPVIQVDGAPAQALDAERLRPLADGALAAWLLERRWFGAKGATVRRARVHDLVVVPDGEVPMAFTRLEVELDDGRVERYQAPLVIRAGAQSPPATLARIEAGATDGGPWWLADGGGDVALAQRVLRAFAAGERFGGPTATWRFAAEAGVSLDAVRDAPPRPTGAEQSNSSVRCGDMAIMKFYRRLEAGAHPEVEMTRYLTRVAGFPHTPALLGVGTVEDAHGGSAVVCMLQVLVPGARDAWELALRRARAFIGARGEQDPQNPFVAEMHELGRITRRMHEALAAATDDPAFVPSDVDAADVAAWTSRAHTVMLESLDLLAERRQAGAVPGAAAAIADAVLRRRGELVSAFADVQQAVHQPAGMRIRHHGDYHLGQVLHDPEGRFWIIDFEGEPARLLAERRARHSPLRDVAGMLRSFAYAAAMAAQEVGGVGVRPIVELRLARWERAARDAFLRGYLEGGNGSRELLPRDARARERLLALFETEKVFYELAYELNNRPEWTWIPLRGIGRMLGR